MYLKIVCEVPVYLNICTQIPLFEFDDLRIQTVPSLETIRQNVLQCSNNVIQVKP